MVKKKKLSREDWCRAALFAWAKSGSRTLSVERLARELGVTKGSFYWHFQDRDALLQAAVEYWRDQGTAQVIADLEVEPDPRVRLKNLFATVFRDLDELRVEAALMAASATGHPVIGPIFAEVIAERIGYLKQLYTEMGADDPECWSQLAFAWYLGVVQLASMQPTVLRLDAFDGVLALANQQLLPALTSADSLRR